MKRLTTLSILAILCAPMAAQASEIVKLSESDICHDSSSPWYEKTKRYIPYESMERCISDGGRLPRGYKADNKTYVDQKYASREKRPYDRDEFGDGWADVDKDCQNTRHEILAQMSTQTVRYTSNGCTVKSGKWISPFTNHVFYDASDLDVDHLFPLALAWERGAYAWDYDKRVRFANDPVNLWPVEAKLNRSKGAKPIAEWLPPENECQYVARYARVAKMYGLPLDHNDEFVVEQCKNGVYAKEGKTLLNLGNVFKIKGSFSFD